MNAAAVAHGEMARRLFAGVEVLMKPVAWRTVNTPLPPLDLDHFVLVTITVGMDAPLFVPKQDVTHRLRPDDNRARTMIVRLVILPDGPLAEVTDQSIA